MRYTSSKAIASVLVNEHGLAIERWVLGRAFEKVGAANHAERSDVVVCELKATHPGPVIDPGG